MSTEGRSKTGGQAIPRLPEKAHCARHNHKRWIIALVRLSNLRNERSNLSISPNIQHSLFEPKYAHLPSRHRLNHFGLS